MNPVRSCLRQGLFILTRFSQPIALHNWNCVHCSQTRTVRVRAAYQNFTAELNDADGTGKEHEDVYRNLGEVDDGQFQDKDCIETKDGDTEIKMLRALGRETDLSKWHHLQSRGCRLYELAEWPDVLALDMAQIDTCVITLIRCGVPRVSVPLMKLAAQGNPPKAISHYIGLAKGHLSAGSYLLQLLQCTEQRLIDIAIRNPRLVRSVNTVNSSVPKLKLLLKKGFTLEQIANNSHLLNNSGNVTILLEKIAMLDEAQVNPLPIHWLVQSKSQVAKMVSRYNTGLYSPNHKGQENGLQKMATLLEVPLQVVLAKPFLCTCSYKRLEQHVNFFLRKGYTKGEILRCTSIINSKVQTIEAALNYFQSKTIERPALGQVLTYLQTKKISQREMNRMSTVYSDVLLCKSKDLPILPKCLRGNLTQIKTQGRETLMENLAFLDHVGLTKEAILKCPLLLGHHTKVLQRHWHKIYKAPEFNKWSSFQLANYLQYSIEKEYNFQFSVVTFFDCPLT